MTFPHLGRVLVQSFRKSRCWALLALALLAAALVCAMKLPFTVTAQNPPLGIVSSASGEKDALAPESLATAYGAQLATQSLSAEPGNPLSTELGGTRVTVRDSGGTERAAFLSFVSPSQVNFIVPAGTLPGQANVTIRAGGGEISTGGTNVNPAAPAIFTFNGDGAGVAAGFALRVRADGQQSYETIARYDAEAGEYKPRPIEPGPPGEQVFLTFFLSGIRAADPGQVRAIIGGDLFAPVFVGAAPSLPGLDQINVPLSRSLPRSGALKLQVAVTGGRTSNETEIEMGGGASTLSISRVGKDRVLVSETLEIFGSNLPAAGVEVLFEPNVGVAPDSFSPDKLTLRVPPGVATGRIKISVNQEVVWTSPDVLNVRTSISGVVQDTRKRGIPGLAIHVRETGISAPTNQDGVFVLADVPPGNREIEIRSIAGQLPFPVQAGRLRVTAARDNQFGRVELNSIGTTQTLADSPAQGGISIDLPPGFTLTPFAAGRTPVDLPAGRFSSVIAQITPFRAPISPGVKLRFPNVDNIPAGTPLRVLKLDQTPGSATLGEFVDLGAAVFAGNGQFIETAPDAASEGSYYFVSRLWPAATIIGHVVEADLLRPARRAIVSARGQSAFTDGNGGFVLRNVPVIKPNDSVTVEVAFHRPDGTVARAERAGVSISAGSADAPTQIADIALAPRTASGARILAPATLAATEGETREFNFVVAGLAAGAQPTMAGAPSFASLRGLGNEAFALRLAPPQGSAGDYLITIIAAAVQQAIAVTVNPANAGALVARADAVTTNEDTPVNIMLASAGGATTYEVSQPMHGSVTQASPSSPNVVYRPAADFNGVDSFSFRARGGGSESAAVVAIAVRPVNDPPVVTVPGPQTLAAGQTLKLLITANDPDGDALICTAPNAPPGATPPVELTPNSWEFTWQPTFTQAGNWNVNMQVRDAALSQTRTVAVTVNARWAKTSGPEGAIANAFAFSTDGANLFAGTNDGVYLSANGGRSWKLVRDGLPQPALVSSLAVSGTTVFAATALSGVFRSTDNGRSWTAVNAGLSNRSVAALAFSGSTLLAGTPSGVFRSTNQGASWGAANSGLPGQRVVASFFNTNVGIFAAVGNGVFLSTNQGSGWRSTGGGLPNLTVRDFTVHNNLLHAATEGAGVFRLESLGGEGEHWEGLPNAGLPTREVISLISVGGSLYAGLQAVLSIFEEGSGGGIYQLSGDGRSWLTRTNGLPSNENVTALTARTVGRNVTLIAGLQGDGVFTSTNPAAGWDSANSGITALEVTAIGSAGPNLFASGGGNFRSVFRSGDGGQSWSLVSSGLPRYTSVTAFANVGSSLFASTAVAGVYRSINQGQDWTPMNNGLPAARFVNDLAVIGNTLFAAAANAGVYVTGNQGQSWSPANGGLSGQNVRVLAVAGTTLYAGTLRGGVYRSINNGQSWTTVNAGLPLNLNTEITALTVNGNFIFASFGAIGLGSGIFRLPAGGSTWTLVNTGLPANEIAYSLTAIGANVFAGLSGGAGVYLSTNDGANWAPLGEGLPFDQPVFELTAAGANLLAGTNAGVYRMSNNVQSWTAINTGLNNRNINSVARSGSHLFAGTLGGGVYRSMDDGQSWSATGTGMPPSANVYAMAVKGSILFAGAFGDGVYRSDNNGQSWTRASTGLTNNLINALAVSGASLFVATDGGVFRTNDDGATWTLGGLTSRTFSLLVNGGNLLAGTDGDGVLLSANNGQTWTPVNTGLTNPFVTALTASGSAIYAGTDGGGVFCSTNNGQSWTPVNTGLPPKLNVFSFAPIGSRIFAGSIYGVFVTENQGASWRQINAGFADVYVTALSSGKGDLFAGTRVGGMFSSQLTAPCALRIATQPGSKAIASGQSVTLTVVAAGEASLQYQWYRGGGGDFSSPVPNANAGSFTTPAVSATTNYWVLVTSACGSASSETASVIVNATPQADLAITQTISPAQPKPGDDLTFILNVTNSGRDTAFSVAVTDALPGELTFSSCSATGGGLCGGAGNNRTVTFAALAPNAAATITLVAKVKADAGGATLRNTASVNASTSDTNLANNTQTSSVTVQTIRPVGIEADVTPRPDGNGGVTVTDWTQIGRFAVGLDTPANGGEYQRADCAPRATFGNGAITVSDWSQAGRYAAGLDPPVPAAGPTAPVASAPAEMSMQAVHAEPRQLRISATGFDPGIVTIESLARGDENALGFSLRFDPRRWRLAAVAVGESAPGATLHLNAQQASRGLVGIALALPPGRTLIAGLHSLVLLKFSATGGAGVARPEISFSDQPVARELVSVDARTLRADWTPIASRELVNVSAASFDSRPLARGSIVAAFGSELAARTLPAESLPLPVSLGGTTVMITDSAGVEHRAPLFFVSPSQINYLLPAETAVGLAEVKIANADGVVAQGVIEVEEVAPSLFTANADGQGIAAAVVLRVRADGSRRIEPVAVFDSGRKKFIAAPIAPGDENEQVFLVLFGTGWRNARGAQAVNAELGDEPLEAVFAGAQESYPGLDQINLLLPRSLRGRGEVALLLNVEGKAANPVDLTIK